MLADYDLIIFDCDGVLVDSEPLAVEAFVAVLREAGVPATADMVERRFGMKQADILLAVAEDTGRDVPAAVAEAIWPATRLAFTRSLRAMLGVEGFLARTGGVKRCVASSSNPERIRLSLGLTGLDTAFGEAVFSSHQVARGKPAPDLFLFAAAAMGAEPARCIVIEDSVYGVQGAVAAGMRAVGFTGGGHIPPGHDAALAKFGAIAVGTSWEDVGRLVLG